MKLSDLKELAEKVDEVNLGLRNDAECMAYTLARDTLTLIEAYEMRGIALQDYVDKNQPSAPGDYYSADGGQIAYDCLTKTREMIEE